MEAKTKNNNTPLHGACCYDDKTPLHIAASVGNTEICQIILPLIKDRHPKDQNGNIVPIFKQGEWCN